MALRCWLFVVGLSQFSDACAIFWSHGFYNCKSTINECLSLYEWNFLLLLKTITPSTVISATTILFLTFFDCFQIKLEQRGRITSSILIASMNVGDARTVSEIKGEVVPVRKHKLSRTKYADLHTFSCVSSWLANGMNTNFWSLSTIWILWNYCRALRLCRNLQPRAI